MIRKPSFLKQVMCLIVAGAMLMLASPAFATPTALTVQVLVLNNGTPSAGGLAITYTACDNVNGNSYTMTGREVLLVRNTDTASHTFTVTPTTDQWGGTNTSLTSYSLAATGSAGADSAVQMKFSQGWATGASSNTINLTCSSALIKYAVVQFN